MLRVQGAMRDAYTIESDQKKETSESELRPLRYNPSLKCDPALEAMRPERLSKHTPLPSSDWKRYLIKTPVSFEGSFAEADLQKFRPSPSSPGVMEDPWYSSQLPSSSGVDTIAAIKMRNRRFQQSCAMEGASLGVRAQPMVQSPQAAEDMMMAASLAYTDLQRQVNMLQTLPIAPVPPPRLNVEEDSLTVSMLPAPRKIVRAQAGEAAPAPAPARGQEQPKHSPAPAQTNPKIIKLEKIKEDVESLTEKIENFKGFKTDKEYLYLEEMLTRHLLSLDGIEPEGETSIRQMRKESINSVNRCLSLLDRKVSDVNTDAAENDRILSELAEKSLENSESNSDKKDDNQGSL